MIRTIHHIESDRIRHVFARNTEFRSISRREVEKAHIPRATNLAMLTVHHRLLREHLPLAEFDGVAAPLDEPIQGHR